MKIRDLLLLGIGAILFFLACSTPTPTTSNCVILINELPSKTPSLYTLEETLCLGGEDNPKVFRPSSLAVDREGTIYCTDDGRIKVFSAEGDFLRYISRSGDGPKEVRKPGIWGMRGDTLFVSPSEWCGPLRVQRFTTHGVWAGYEEQPAEIEVDYLAEGHVLASISQYCGNNRWFFHCAVVRTEGDYQYRNARYGLFDVAQQKAVSLDCHGGEWPFRFIYKWSNQIIFSSLPYTRDLPSFAVKGDTLAVLTRKGDELILYDKKGERLLTVQFNVAGDKVSRADKAWFNKPRPGMFPKPEGLKGKLIFPERHPLFIAVQWDSKGQLWLKRRKSIEMSMKGEYEYYIFNDTGRILGRQVLHVMPSVITDTEIYGFDRNENDEPVIKRFSYYKNQQ